MIFTQETTTMPEGGNDLKNGRNKRKIIICAIIVAVIVLCVIVVAQVVGSGKKEKAKAKAKATETVNTTKKTEEVSSTDSNPQEKNENKESTNSTDREVGLKNVKLRDAGNLTEEQKMVAQYFNHDYIPFAPESTYEFFQRYPNVFKGMEFSNEGKVCKVLKSDSQSYELLINIEGRRDSVANGTADISEDDGQRFMVIRGKQEAVQLIEGDEIGFIAGYEGVEDFLIDGISYHVPVATISHVTIYKADEPPILYDADYIKTVAKTIFGEDIMVRVPNADEGIMGYGYICELENQSNAKFSKYYFLSNDGRLIDAKSTNEIERSIEFAPDFEHFFLLIQDNQLNTLTLEYYDKNLKKIWKREFEGTVSLGYDYTSTSVYAVINKELYILDINTGEDKTKPTFIGEKAYVRKLEDGIITVDTTSNIDSIMKMDLEGNIIWKLNTVSVCTAAWIQVIGDTIIVGENTTTGEPHIMQINNQTGEMLADAILVQ